MTREVPKPTEAELSILRVLWERWPSTVREVHEAIQRSRPSGQTTGYTTVLKLLQIMTEKGLVTRDERTRSHVYRARLSEDTTQRQLVTDLLDRVFDGSAAQLVLQALATNKTSPEELDEIRKLLATKSGGSR